MVVLQGGVLAEMVVLWGGGAVMRGGWKKYVGILVPLGAVVAAPLLMRDRETEGAQEADLRLEIITPHNETIRREFGEAFAEHWEEKTGESVYVNWRVPGGTSEIKRVLGSSYEGGGGDRERGGWDRHLLRGRSVRFHRAGEAGTL